MNIFNYAVDGALSNSWDVAGMFGKVTVGVTWFVINLCDDFVVFLTNRKIKEVY